MKKQKPVYTTELRRQIEHYYNARLRTMCCVGGLMYIAERFYDLPDSPSRIWIEWYAKPVPGACTVTPEPNDMSWTIGTIRSGKHTHHCPWGAWRVLPEYVLERHRTLYAKVYYQE